MDLAKQKTIKLLEDLSNDIRQHTFLNKDISNLKLNKLNLKRKFI